MKQTGTLQLWLWTLTPLFFLASIFLSIYFRSEGTFSNPDSIAARNWDMAVLTVRVLFLCSFFMRAILISTQKPHISDTGLAYQKLTYRLGVAAVLLVGLPVMTVDALSYRRSASRESHTCRSNLWTIDAAKEQWALDQSRKTGALVTWENLVGPGLYIKSMPHCPNRGEYVLGNIGQDTFCRIHGKNPR